MKILKIVLIAIGAIFVIFIIALVIYLLASRQGVIEPFEVGSSEAEQKVLIASQGSDFKNALVESLATNLGEKQIYVKIIDVTTLHEVNEDDWDAVVLIHTTEQSKLQPDVKKYLDRAKDLGKVVILTTSGSGDWKTEDYDIDVMTSASKMNELSSFKNDILNRVDMIQKKDTLSTQ